MSRLTASPFHKPSPQEIVRGTATPPDSRSGEHAHMQSMNSVAGPIDSTRPFDSESMASTQMPEGPGARFRKLSSIAYTSSGLRGESRDRIVQRGAKSFIIVIPSPSVMHEYGQLGHTLSSGPSHRLSQGLLMPLFPTMYGQLTAIAREFNFPSTAGLCIYLHHSDNGVLYTPRISDDLWSQLWATMVDVGQPSTLTLPICGRIEFDVDTSAARWYSAWIASSQRKTVEPTLNPSISVGHSRIDSRTTYLEETIMDEQPERLLPRPRHVPRKLSLVDRFDNASVTTTKRPPAQRSVIAIEQMSSKTLSPIHQSEDAGSEKIDLELENRVKSWRASAQLEPTSLAAMGQTSLEPANMPNSLLLEEGQFGLTEEPFRLEDFTWSISSKGPVSETLDSPSVDSYIASVHLDRRLQGSVCLSPSVCTSFGPSDYTLSPLSTASFRVLTPDLAMRYYEEVPMTPSTATSWGPRSVASYKLDDDDDVVDVDLAQRMILSPPDTPMTATSWGPGSWPPSPIESEYRPPSVDLGARGAFSRPTTPSTATSWGAPLSYPPSPSTPFYVSTPDTGARSFDVDLPFEAQLTAFHRRVAEEESTVHWRHVPQDKGSGPSEAEETAAPWLHMWPYMAKLKFYDSIDKTTAKEENTSSLNLSVSYPSLVIYPPVYPHFRLYPAPACTSSYETTATKAVDVSAPVSVTYPIPSLAQPKISSLSQIKTEALVIDVKVGLRYPTFELYPAVYPNVIPYPAILKMAEKVTTALGDLSYSYPDFDLYPVRHNSGPPDSSVSGSYSERMPTHTSSAFKSISYHPAWGLHPSAYPHFDLYHSADSKTDVVSTIAIKSVPSIEIVLGCATYPIIQIYRSVYPHLDVYPSLPKDVLEKDSMWSAKTVLQSSYTYPTLVIYPAIYPHFDLYPTVFIFRDQTEWDHPSHVVAPASKVVANVLYPYLTIYPAVYPQFELWAAPSAQMPVRHARRTHRQLHDIVMKSMAASRMPAPRRKIKKSHLQLHNEVVSDLLKRTEATMPATTTTVRSARPSVVTQAGSPPPRRISLLTRSPNRTIPPVTAPPLSRALPILPPDISTEPDAHQRISSFEGRGLPSRPDGNSISRGSPPTLGRRELPRLSRLDEGLTRTVSMNMAPPRSEEKKLLRSQSTHVRKRDSLVLQRVKAINSGRLDEQLDILDNFPVPPTAPRMRTSSVLYGRFESR